MTDDRFSTITFIIIAALAMIVCFQDPITMPSAQGRETLLETVVVCRDAIIDAVVERPILVVIVVITVNGHSCRCHRFRDRDTRRRRSVFFHVHDVGLWYI